MLVRCEEGMVAWKQPIDATNWRQYQDWQLHINHAWRDADLLATSGATFLFEYYMPSGKSYLVEVSIRSDRFSPIGNSINRKRIPDRWKGYLAT